MNTIEELKSTLLRFDFPAFEKSLKRYNIHERDNFGNNILHCYIRDSGDFNDFEDVIRVIVEAGLDINERQSKGAFKRSPLHIAVFRKLANVADYLIRMGADVNSVDANGNSVLFTAVMWYRNQDEQFVEKLIQSGANVFQENNHGISPIALAQSIGNYDVRKYFDKSER